MRHLFLVLSTATASWRSRSLCVKDQLQFTPFRHSHPVLLYLFPALYLPLSLPSFPPSLDGKKERCLQAQILRHTSFLNMPSHSLAQPHAACVSTACPSSPAHCVRVCACESKDALFERVFERVDRQSLNMNISAWFIQAHSLPLHVCVCNTRNTRRKHLDDVSLCKCTSQFYVMGEGVTWLGEGANKHTNTHTYHTRTTRLGSKLCTWYYVYCTCILYTVWYLSNINVQIICTIVQCAKCKEENMTVHVVIEKILFTSLRICLNMIPPRKWMGRYYKNNNIFKQMD